MLIQIVHGTYIHPDAGQASAGAPDGRDLIAVPDETAHRMIAKGRAIVPPAPAELDRHAKDEWSAMADRAGLQVPDGLLKRELAALVVSAGAYAPELATDGGEGGS